MNIDNDMYSRPDFGWWDDNPDSTTVLLRYVFHPIRFAYFEQVLKRENRPPDRPRNVMDVGCGGGYLCEAFAKADFDVTGVDRSANTIYAATQHATESGLHISYRQGSAEDLPFDDASFDCVSCCDVLEHVDDLGKTVAEISRVLRPNGLFFYQTINRTLLSWITIIKVAQDWQRTAWEAPHTHEWRRFVKPSELRTIMAATDLRMHENRGIGPGSDMKTVIGAVRERARGAITRYEMASRFGFEMQDNLGGIYIGYASKTRR